MGLIQMFTSGVVFGYALVMTGLVSGDILDDTTKYPDMFPLWLTDGNVYVYITILYLLAVGSSSLVIYATNRFGFADIRPRTESSYGWFGYDGNFMGGFLQGIGMVMAKSEPGIVFVRAGLGKTGVWLTILGGVFGGFTYVLGHTRLKKRKVNIKGGFTKHDVKQQEASKLQVRDKGVIPSESFVLGLRSFGVLSVLFLCLLAARVNVERVLWTKGLRGGLMIGLAQLISILLTRSTLGVSSIYPSFALHILRLMDDTRSNPGYNSFAFTFGLMFCGYIISLFNPSITNQQERIASVSGQYEFIGGFLTILGARLAGGCISGHGVSGCGAISRSSWVTVAAMPLGALIWSLFKIVFRLAMY